VSPRRDPKVVLYRPPRNDIYCSIAPLNNKDGTNVCSVRNGIDRIFAMSNEPRHLSRRCLFIDEDCPSRLDNSHASCKNSTGHCDGGASMFRSVGAVRALLVGILLTIIGCSIPPLESQLEGGPRVQDIVEHINCELAPIVQISRTDLRLIDRMEPDLSTPIGRLIGRIQADHSFHRLLRRLIKDHFVASVLMTLDVLDSEGLNPSLNLIHPLYPGTPLSSMYNVTLAVGGSLTGSQERNISLGYSIDLEHIPNQCAPFSSGRAPTGLSGDLGLTDIIVDGLLGLQEASPVNIYGGSGPTVPPLTYRMTNWYMRVDFDPDELLNFDGSIAFTPSTSDARAPGTISLTGTVIPDKQVDRSTGKEDNSKNSYFINLTGSTFQAANGGVSFLFTGNMTQSTPTDDASLATLGFSPKLTLTGIINTSGPVPIVTITSGSVTPDTAAAHVLNGNPPTLSNTPKPINVVVSRTKPPITNPAAAGGAAPAGGSSAKNNAAAPSSSSTQFSSLINFIVSYGLNGGPNWTLKKFKGPSGGGGGGSSSSGGSGGGGGGSGSLASISRTDTDTLSITFVAACKNAENSQNPKDFWQALPHCDQNAVATAKSIGDTVNRSNFLIQRLGP
jgi:hypothetical protein